MSARAPTRTPFPAPLLRAIESRASLKVRAGRGPHRFLGIWAVVVDDRVFVRSWNDAPTGWYRAWRSDPHGAILAGTVEIPVRAVAVRGAGLLDRVSAAYREKYWRPGSRRYAEGMDTPARRRTTLELRPEPDARTPSAARAAAAATRRRTELGRASGGRGAGRSD